MFKKLLNTGLHNMYASPNSIRKIKSGRLKSLGHVARMRNIRRIQNLVRKPRGKRLLGRFRRRWEDNRTGL
jgi:hypothetical protein